MDGVTQKHRDFVSEPMEGKLITDVPGIGKAAGKRLAHRGYSQASVLLGQYLVCGNEEAFSNFLKINARVKANNARAAYNALREWNHAWIH